MADGVQQQQQQQQQQSETEERLQKEKLLTSLCKWVKFFKCMPKSGLLHHELARLVLDAHGRISLSTELIFAGVLLTHSFTCRRLLLYILRIQQLDIPGLFFTHTPTHTTVSNEIILADRFK